MVIGGRLRGSGLPCAFNRGLQPPFSGSVPARHVSYGLPGYRLSVATSQGQVRSLFTRAPSPFLQVQGIGSLGVASVSGESNGSSPLDFSKKNLDYRHKMGDKIAYGVLAHLARIKVTF